jgi:hypothetical protein
MGVDRTDYLMWGALVDPHTIDFDRDLPEISGEHGCEFDLVYDGMCGEYAIAGKIVATSTEYEGFDFLQIPTDDLVLDPTVLAAVKGRFPEAENFGLYLFSHFY